MPGLVLPCQPYHTPPHLAGGVSSRHECWCAPHCDVLLRRAPAAFQHKGQHQGKHVYAQHQAEHRAEGVWRPASVPYPCQQPPPSVPLTHSASVSSRREVLRLHCSRCSTYGTAFVRTIAQVARNTMRCLGLLRCNTYSWVCSYVCVCRCLPTRWCTSPRCTLWLTRAAPSLHCRPQQALTAATTSSVGPWMARSTCEMHRDACTVQLQYLARQSRATHMGARGSRGTFSTCRGVPPCCLPLPKDMHVVVLARAKVRPTTCWTLCAVWYTCTAHM